MSATHFIPSSLHEAASYLRLAWSLRLRNLSRTDFVRVWSSVAYLFPGLHADGFGQANSGWPRALERFAAEAWRRVEAGELADEELYPSDAQWAGLYDRMEVHTLEEMERRHILLAFEA